MRWITSEYLFDVPDFENGWTDRYLEAWDLLG